MCLKRLVLRKETKGTLKEDQRNAEGTRRVSWMLNVYLDDIRYACQFILNVLKVGNLLLRLFEIQATGVVAVELGEGGAFHVAFLEVFIVIERAVVGWDTVEITHILGLSALLVGQQRLIHLFSVTYPDNLNLGFHTLGGLVLEQVTDGLGLGLDGAGRSFLHKDVAVLSVLEGEQHEIDGLFERHDEAGHPGLGEGDGVALAYLVYPQGDDGAAGAHHIAIAGAADLSVAAETALGNGDFLLYGFGDAHGVDGVGCLVCREADDALNARINGGIQGIVRTDDIRLHSLHGEELATGHLLQGSGMKDVVHSLHCIVKRTLVAYVTDIELDLACHLWHSGLEVVTHIVLLLLVAAEDTNLANVRPQKTIQHCITKRTRPAGNQ